VRLQRHAPNAAAAALTFFAVENTRLRRHNGSVAAERYAQKLSIRYVSGPVQPNSLFLSATSANPATIRIYNSGNQETALASSKFGTKTDGMRMQWRILSCFPVIQDLDLRQSE
jgi:hypothetical protein